MHELWTSCAAFMQANKKGKTGGIKRSPIKRSCPMASQIFSENLTPANYSFNDPLHALLPLSSSLVSNSWNSSGMVVSLDDSNGGKELKDIFCALVDDVQVWQLAQMVVPEFRLLREREQ